MSRQRSCHRLRFRADPCPTTCGSALLTGSTGARGRSSTSTYRPIMRPLWRLPTLQLATIKASRHPPCSRSDADNDTITNYEFWDSTVDPASGHWAVSGVPQSAGQAIDVTAAQLSQTTFQSGSVSDDLWVRAFDGIDWSAWEEFHLNVPANHAPVVAASDLAVSHNQSIAASSLFSQRRR